MPTNLYIFEKLLKADSRDQIESFLDRQCDQLGYSSYIYTPLAKEIGVEKVFTQGPATLNHEVLKEYSVFSTYPASWISRYQEAEHLKADPILREVSSGNLPVFWDDISRADRKNIVLDEARQHGLIGRRVQGAQRRRVG